jgi:hypothetical protein
MAEILKVSDTFTYSDGSLPTVSSSAWADRRNTVDVTTARATTTTSGFAIATVTGGSGWTDEQYAEVTVTATSSTREGVALRYGPDASPNEDGYIIYYEQDLNVVRILKFDNGSQSFVGSDISVTFSNGQELKAYVETSGADAVFTIFQDTVQIATRTDNSGIAPTNGRPGVLLSSASAAVDNFVGGILGTVVGEEYELVAGSFSVNATFETAATDYSPGGFDYIVNALEWDVNAFFGDVSRDYEITASSFSAGAVFEDAGVDFAEGGTAFTLDADAVTVTVTFAVADVLLNLSAFNNGGTKRPRRRKS